MRKLFLIVLVWIAAALNAQPWKSLLAYNNVTQIALAPECVYAVSDGSLFSVDKLSEQLITYPGLHGVGISCIYYDAPSAQLYIAYSTGKMDVLSARGIQYIGDLYDKDMTQQKTIYNFTVHGRTAYLSTHYGVQTFDLRTNRFVDSYWIGPQGGEMAISDVLIRHDSIYAFTTDSVFSADLNDKPTDYRLWRREARTGAVAPDTEKGVHYTDGADEWYAGHEEGIIRFTPTERLTYKPDGPLSNMAYSLNTYGKHVYMLQGGRWAAQNMTPGVVMRYDGTRWLNISQSDISTEVSGPVLDFMNTAVDPCDESHFFVTSYGTGLYEFRNGHVVRRYLPADDNPIRSAIPTQPQYYTRLDCARFDTEGNLWFVNAHEVEYQLIVLDKDSGWHGIPVTINNTHVTFETPGAMLLDRYHPNYVWIADARGVSALYLLDLNGTPYEPSDDRAIGRNEWLTQTGQHIRIEQVITLMQDQSGRVWLGTEQGILGVEADDYFSSDLCFRPQLMDNNGENPLESLRVRAICEDTEGSLWVGTETMGVYVLNSSATEIEAHYTTDNSTMPSNTVLSLACDAQGKIYVGTSDGLACYEGKYTEGGVAESDADKETHLGTMQQWKLHFSYVNPQELAASGRRIYAAANGSLFSVNRADESIDYWNKSTGLNGSSVSHIAFDAASEQLIITYEDGRIDLMDEEGNVVQMPDLYMKAGSVAVTINGVAVGSRYAYLGTSFGIIAVNMRKAEMAETYYIGPEASNVEVQHIVELGDTLYAFSYNQLYKASLRDNLADFAFWTCEPLPCEQVQQAAVWRDRIYTLQHDSLYRRAGSTWQLVRPEPMRWIQAHDGKLLVFVTGKGLFELDDADQLLGLSSRYSLNSAVYTNGEYWLAEVNNGLIRLGTNGDSYFHTEGPNSNFGYRMCATHNRMYTVSGGRWAAPFVRQGRMNIYDGKSWQGINEWQISSALGTPAYDLDALAVDPSDAGHFFAASYGRGVFEFRDFKAYKHYSTHNSTLREAVTGIDPHLYTYTDGAMLDEQGNLWVLNATAIGWPVHVMNPAGQWFGLSLVYGGKNQSLSTPTGIWTDKRNKQWKWMMDQRGESRLILLDDGGTPTRNADDRCVVRSTFVDQNGATVAPSNFICFAQDNTNRIWVGTDNGIVLIPSTVDFFTSNACRRIIIPRNDGTGLGDYLLGNERINCLAVDGGNRMWIGTANSGLYLIEDDTITVAHFTDNNSLLPSNTIQSIAIMPTTGEVFVGTDKGVASYRSDASAPQADFSSAYAFPNPVRPNYSGKISIAGLMDNTVVNIVDAAGNLVCKTRSHGGLAVWDGCLPDGRRATSGVYTALCNAEGGHTVVKILVISK